MKTTAELESESSSFPKFHRKIKLGDTVLPFPGNKIWKSLSLSESTNLKSDASKLLSYKASGDKAICSVRSFIN